MSNAVMYVTTEALHLMDQSPLDWPFPEGTAIEALMAIDDPYYIAFMVSHPDIPDGSVTVTPVWKRVETEKGDYRIEFMEWGYES